ncbi:MAG TPA: c-type cytochrome [Vicinamibacterales bacterium]|nr:c-type cytochrome [Vicinamibacterales bacterium]
MKEHRRRPGRGMPFRKGVTPRTGVGWRATLRAGIWLLVLFALLGCALAYSIVSRGLSAHDEPSRAEKLLARTMRNWATPEGVRNRQNPLQATPEVLDQGLMHFADHCATCHGNDGGGDTSMGRGFYPRVPDMRTAATQGRTDGELFWIIEHGIRLTGMPAWGDGTPESERESWRLVHFIRRLPKLTDEEIERMESLNPKTREQWREEEEARRFLAGEDAKASASTQHKHPGTKK